MSHRSMHSPTNWTSQILVPFFLLANPSSLTITCLQSIKLFGLPASGCPLLTNPLPTSSSSFEKRNLIKNENWVTPLPLTGKREFFLPVSSLFVKIFLNCFPPSVASKKGKVSGCKRGTGFPSRGVFPFHYFWGIKRWTNGQNENGRAGFVNTHFCICLVEIFTSRGKECNNANIF